MDKFSKGYLLLQEIRDESHRFAIQLKEKEKIASKDLFSTKLVALVRVTKKSTQKI